MPFFWGFRGRATGVALPSSELNSRGDRAEHRETGSRRPVAVEDGTKRWAIAPPPPQEPTDTAVSGEFTLAINGDLLNPDSSFVSRRTRAQPEHSQVRRSPPLTVSPDEIEPFDSDRPTESPVARISGCQGLEREVPTIPAPLWNEEGTTERPAPSVATGRGFFLESVSVDEKAEPSMESSSTLPPFQLDSDEPV